MHARAMASPPQASRAVEVFRAAWEAIIARDVSQHGRQTLMDPTPVPEAGLAALERRAGPG